MNSHQRITIDEIEKLEKEIEYKEIQHYFEALKYGTKPETASADLLKKLAEDVLDKTGFSEVKIKGGFGDFAIQENKVNPILIELKPAFDRTYYSRKTMTGIEAVKLEIPKHKDQVQKYLSSNDFIILTNLSDCYLFNRDALIEYKPFQKLKFTELLTTFLHCENLWDTVRTDEGSFGLRKLALLENKLLALLSFENKGFAEEGKTTKTKIFPDVHPQFKFSIVFVQKNKPHFRNLLLEELR